MRKALAVLGLFFGLTAVSHAGTPQETYFPGQAPLSGTTILASSAGVIGTAIVTLTISTPPVLNSGGGSFNGRNCFTKFVVQMSTQATLTIADNLTTKWTIYGIGLGTGPTNTLVLPEDHLGPFCTAVGDQTVFTITPSASLAANSEVIAVEGYTEYGGTLNSGNMQ